MSLKNFLRNQCGNATIEFVILFPLFVMILLMSIESGIYMARTIILDRSVDIVTRSLRIGTVDHPTFADLKNNICAQSILFPNCENVVKIELVRVDPTNWWGLQSSAQCVDKIDEIDPSDEKSTPLTVDNDLMIIRACVVVAPWLPTTILGARLQQMENGTYALVSTSAYVTEPA